MIVHSNKRPDIPDKDLMDEWKRLQVTERIWNYFLTSYDPLEGLRSCTPDKIEYFRGQADMMDDLRRIFANK